jgi:hypothetical protein
LSLTLTVKLQLEALFAESVTVQETGVTPSGKTEPEGGEQVVVRPGQLSVADGSGYLTTAVCWP